MFNRCKYTRYSANNIMLSAISGRETRGFLSTRKCLYALERTTMSSNRIIYILKNVVRFLKSLNMLNGMANINANMER